MLLSKCQAEITKSIRYDLLHVLEEQRHFLIEQKARYRRERESELAREVTQ